MNCAIGAPPPLDKESRGSKAALWLAVHRHRGSTVVCVGGQLDAASTASMADALTRFLGVREGLVVDLDALQFCSVAGLEFFMYFDRRCRGARYPWALVPGPSLRRLLRQSGVILPAAASLDDAVDVLEAAHSCRPVLRAVT